MNTRYEDEPTYGYEDYEQDDYTPGGQNIGLLERVASAVVGGSALLMGGRRAATGHTPSALALLGIGGYLTYRGISGHCPVYEGMNAHAPDTLSHPFSREIDVAQSITINRPQEELYDFWRNVTNLAQVMEHVQQIEQLDERRSRWTVHGPGGRKLTWVANMVEEIPVERLVWITEESDGIDHRGSVTLVPARHERGTRITVRMAYRPRGGAVTAWAARLFRSDPSTEIRNDLRRFKQYMETGEFATNAGPSARDEFTLTRTHTPTPQSLPSGERSGDPVTHASEESFPASDAPAFGGR